LGIWLSQPTGIEEIAQLICLEVIGRVFTFHEALHNLFSFLSILETRGKRLKSIAIPLLGTGSQGFEKSEVIPALLDESLRFLQISRAIQEVHFVVFSEMDASRFSSELDAQLGNGLIRLSDGKTIDHIKKLPPGMGWMLRQPK
jgi:O-acetyl-ADP-ribose deacetylase (regulator of RNase III)